MTTATGHYFHHFRATMRRAFLGPQILAFVPALTLGGYWFGGEALMVVMAIVIPASLGMVGLFSPPRFPDRSRGPVDPATGLTLRDALIAGLDTRFCKEAETGLRTAALALEIDEFETLRDLHGQGSADHILGLVAERLQATLRNGDMISRMDNSVFAVALAPSRRVDLESMIQLAARLQTAVAEPILIDGLRLYLTASVGFCIPRRASEKIGLVCLEAAEAALAEAQASGTGAIRAFASQPRRKRIMRAGLVNEVSEALETGQIRPWYQPQISCDTGDITGVEALARWDHPDRGIILPGAFLPAISAAGLNERLSEVMLFQSLNALKGWDVAGLGVPSVAVNFSNDELADPKLCEKIRWELDRFDLAPDRLTVEILETVIAKSGNDTVTRNIARLSELGCAIDLDDFGTGHASIANIRRFAVSRIKIDRSFVSHVDSDRQQQQMLTAILEMAERLDVDTLAEGVETVGEHALLAQLGCGHVQGYSIARPMPAEDLPDWIRAHREKLDSDPYIVSQAG